MMEFERSKFFYEIPIKRSMVWCNKNYKNGDNQTLLLSIGLVLNYLPFDGMILVLDLMDKVKEADFFEHWGKAPELYLELREAMNYIGFPWIKEDACSLSLEGLKVWSE